MHGEVWGLGLSTLWGSFFGSACETDYSKLGSIFRGPFFSNPCRGSSNLSLGQRVQRLPHS